jgi:TonB family protein
VKKHRPNTEHLKSTEIEAYLNASLSDSEMHRIERHLLECEFCNEAMDGYASTYNEINIQNELDDLKMRIDRRVKKRSFPLFRIAAIAIVLIGAAIYIANYVVSENKRLQFSEKKPVKTELKEESKKIDKEEGKSDSSDINSSILDNKKNEEGEKSEKKIIKVSPLKEGKALQEKKLIQNDIESVKEDIIEADNIVSSEKSTYQAKSESNYTMEAAEEEVIVDNIQISKQIEREKNDFVVASSTMESDSLIIHGRILDENEEAIPFAVIQNNDKKKRTKSDLEGNYQIEAEKGDEIEVQNIGYESTQVIVANEQSLDVALKAGVDLEEITVLKSADQNSKAMPYIGNEEYEAYLNENLRYPEKAKEANIQGKVIVAFLIDESGNMSRFNITKSLGYGCDEEAIRLIKEGPQWKSAYKKGKPIKDEVKVKVQFK